MTSDEREHDAARDQQPLPGDADRTEGVESDEDRSAMSPFGSGNATSA